MGKIKSFWNERWAKIETKSPTKRREYYISDYGRIKSVDKETGGEYPIKGNKLVGGFRVFGVRLANKKLQQFFIHRQVAMYFLDKPEEDQILVIHLDGDRNNNYYKNLKWMSLQERRAFRAAKGLDTKAELRDQRISHYKMTEEKVRLLKKRLKAGKTKKKILARSFGITYMQLNRIERGENWGDVKIDDDE